MSKFEQRQLRMPLSCLVALEDENKGRKKAPKSNKLKLKDGMSVPIAY